MFPNWQLSNFDSVCFVSSFAMTFSNTLPGAGVREMGLRSDRDFGGFDFGIGTILAFFHCDGKVHLYSDAFIMSHIGVTISGANSVRIRGGMSHIPGDFDETLFNNM